MNDIVDLFEDVNEYFCDSLRFNCGKRSVHSVQMSNYMSSGIVGHQAY